LRNWEKGNKEFIQQFQVAEEYNKVLPEEVKYPDYQKKMHAGAVYTSRLLPTKEITQLLDSKDLDLNSETEQQAQILQPTNLPYGTPGSSK
jgi:hypothetical protein